jgi:hypothetical protein
MHVYMTGPIDLWEKLRTVDEYCGSILSIVNPFIEKDGGAYGDGEVNLEKFHHILQSLQEAMELAQKVGWDGDIREGPFIFLLPDVEHGEMKFGFIWKQDNDGITFIASPFPLPWVTKASCRYDEKSRKGSRNNGTA